MKKLLIILFAFAFLGAFAKTHNYENNPDVPDHTAASIMQFSQTDRGAAANQSDRYDLRDEDRKGHYYGSTSGGHGNCYSTDYSAQGHYDSNKIQTRLNSTDRESRNSFGHMSMRFVTDSCEAIRDDYNQAEIGIRSTYNTRYNQRTQRLAKADVQYRPYRYTTARYGRYLEVNTKQA